MNPPPLPPNPLPGANAKPRRYSTYSIYTPDIIRRCSQKKKKKDKKKKDM